MKLVVLNGASAGTVFFLADVPTVVGRSHEAHLLIADPWISSMHAMLERRGDELWVVDLASRNGTFVGGERVTEGRVRDGAVVRFGRTEIRVEVKRGSLPVPVPAPDEPPRTPLEQQRGTLRVDLTLSVRSPITAREGEPSRGIPPRPATVLRMAVDAAGMGARPGAPEQLRAALDAAARVAGDAGATVARLAGVGVLAVFGLEGPLPDAAALAVAAARAARREVRTRGGLDLRAAIETGPVITNDAGPSEIATLGPAAELAERLVALAGRGELLAGPGAGPAAGLARIGLRAVGDTEVEVFRADL